MTPDLIKNEFLYLLFFSVNKDIIHIYFEFFFSVDHEQ